MRDITATQRVHLWFEDSQGMFLGLGRVQLLERIEEFGSLNKAAASLGMSYRAAWGRLKRTEAVLGQSLVERDGPRRGFRLSELGKNVIAMFRAWQDDVEAHAVKRAREIFPWSVEPFADDGTPAP